MMLSKEWIGMEVISVSDGRRLGRVKDVYLDANLKTVVGLYLGNISLLDRKPKLISRENVTVYGEDAILVKGSDVVNDDKQIPGATKWIRRDRLQGREVATTGGTQVGRIGDVILGDQEHVVGFSLSRVSVEGPVAEKRARAREAVLDTGNKTDVMTIDLAKAEQQKLSTA